MVGLPSLERPGPLAALGHLRPPHAQMLLQEERNLETFPWGSPVMSVHPCWPGQFCTLQGPQETFKPREESPIQQPPALRPGRGSTTPSCDPTFNLRQLGREPLGQAAGLRCWL